MLFRMDFMMMAGVVSVVSVDDIKFHRYLSLDYSQASVLDLAHKSVDDLRLLI